MNSDQRLSSVRAAFAEGDHRNFDFFDYLHAEGSPRLALFYSLLFWPEFVELQGMVFLKDTMEDEDDRARLRDAIGIYSGSWSKVEQSFNTMTIEELFGKYQGEFTIEEDKMLVDVLVGTWAARLAVCFPSKHFVVRPASDEETGAGVGIVFYQDL